MPELDRNLLASGWYWAGSDTLWHGTFVGVHFLVGWLNYFWLQIRAPGHLHQIFELGHKSNITLATGIHTRLWSRQQFDMAPWRPLSGLLFWCPIFKWSHCNSFEDGPPVDFIYGWPIVKWVAEIWLVTWQGTRIIIRSMATKATCPIIDLHTCAASWTRIHDFLMGCCRYFSTPKLIDAIMRHAYLW